MFCTDNAQVLAYGVGAFPVVLDPLHQGIEAGDYARNHGRQKDGKARGGRFGMISAAVAQDGFVVRPLLGVGLAALRGLQVVAESGCVGLGGFDVGLADLQRPSELEQLGGEVFDQVGLAEVVGGKIITCGLG